MKQPQVRERASVSTRWAPWWLYLATIVGANHLRKSVLGDGSAPALRVAVALAFSAVIFVIITLVFRRATTDGEAG